MTGLHTLFHVIHGCSNYGVYSICYRDLKQKKKISKGPLKAGFMRLEVTKGHFICFKAFGREQALLIIRIIGT